MSRSEFERRKILDTHGGNHSLNQRRMKLHLEGQRRMEASRVDEAALKQQVIEEYDLAKAERIMHRVERVMAGYDGLDLVVFKAEVKYLRKLGLIPETSNRLV